MPATLKNPSVGGNYYESQGIRNSANVNYEEDMQRYAELNNMRDVYADMLKKGVKSNIDDYSFLESVESRMYAQQYEAYADRATLRDYEIMNEETGELETKQMTEYQYNKRFIDQEIADAKQRIKDEEIRNIQKSQWWWNLMIPVDAVGRFAQGVGKGAAEVIDLIISPIVAGIETGFNDKSFDENWRQFMAEGGVSRVTDFTDEMLTEFEKNMSLMRDPVTGEMINAGKYVVGVSESLGQMILLLVPGTIAIKGVKIGVGAALFYTSMMAGNTRERLQDPKFANTSSWMILGESAAQAAMDYALQAAVGKIFGNRSIFDAMFFGSTMKAGARQIALKAALKAGPKELLKNVFQEGVEEFTQEIGSYAVEGIFGLIESNFGKTDTAFGSELTLQRLGDAFTIGMLAAAIGSYGRVAFTQNKQIGNTKLTKMQTYSFNQIMSDFYKSQSDALKKTKDIATRQEIVGNMYGMFETISSFIGEMGSERFKQATEALETLGKMVDAKKESEETLKMSQVDYINKITENFNELIKDVKVTEKTKKEAKETLKENSSELQDNEYTEILKVFDETTETIENIKDAPTEQELNKGKQVMAETSATSLVIGNGKQIIDNGPGKPVIIPSDTINNVDTSQIAQDIAAKRAITNTQKSLKTDEVTFLNDMASEYTNGTDNVNNTTKGNVTRLLYDQKFQKHIIRNLLNNKNHKMLKSLLTKIKNYTSNTHTVSDNIAKGLLEQNYNDLVNLAMNTIAQSDGLAADEKAIKDLDIFSDEQITYIKQKYNEVRSINNVEENIQLDKINNADKKVIEKGLQSKNLLERFRAQVALLSNRSVTGVLSPTETFLQVGMTNDQVDGSELYQMMMMLGIDTYTGKPITDNDKQIIDKQIKENYEVDITNEQAYKMAYFDLINKQVEKETNYKYSFLPTSRQLNGREFIFVKNLLSEEIFKEEYIVKRKDNESKADYYKRLEVTKKLLLKNIKANDYAKIFNEDIANLFANKKVTFKLTTDEGSNIKIVNGGIKATISSNKSNIDLIEIFSHETNHIFQTIYDLPEGGNVDYFIDKDISQWVSEKMGYSWKYIYERFRSRRFQTLLMDIQHKFPNSISIEEVVGFAKYYESLPISMNDREKEHKTAEFMKEKLKIGNESEIVKNFIQTEEELKGYKELDDMQKLRSAILGDVAPNKPANIYSAYALIFGEQSSENYDFYYFKNNLSKLGFFIDNKNKIIVAPDGTTRPLQNTKVKKSENLPTKSLSSKVKADSTGFLADNKGIKMDNRLQNLLSGDPKRLEPGLKNVKNINEFRDWFNNAKSINDYTFERINNEFFRNPEITNEQELKEIEKKIMVQSIEKNPAYIQYKKLSGIMNNPKTSAKQQALLSDRIDKIQNSMEKSEIDTTDYRYKIMMDYKSDEDIEAIIASILAGKNLQSANDKTSLNTDTTYSNEEGDADEGAVGRASTEVDDKAITDTDKRIEIIKEEGKKKLLQKYKREVENGAKKTKKDFDTELEAFNNKIDKLNKNQIEEVFTKIVSTAAKKGEIEGISVDRSRTTIQHNMQRIDRTIRKYYTSELWQYMSNMDKALINKEDGTLKDSAYKGDIGDSQLKAKEQRLRIFSKWVQAHAYTEKLGARQLKKTSEQKVPKDKKAKIIVETRVKTVFKNKLVLGSNGSVVVATNVKANENVEKLFKTAFTGTSKRSIIGIELDNEEQVKYSLKEFLATNSEAVMSLNSGDIDNLLAFIDQAIFDNSTREDIKHFNVMTIMILDTILNMNYKLLSKTQRTKIEEILTTSLSESGTSLAVHSRIVVTLNPTKQVIANLFKQQGITISEDSIQAYSDSIKSGNMTDIEQSAQELLEEMKANNKNVFWLEKFFRFRNMAMLSSPFTVIRNWQSNMILTGADIASESAGTMISKLWGHKHDEVIKKTKQYRLTGTIVSQQVKEFIDKELRNKMVKSDGKEISLLRSLVKSAENMDITKINSKDNSAFENLMLNRLVTKFHLDTAYNSKGLNYANKFIRKLMSDNIFIEKKAMVYFAKMLTEDNTSLSEGFDETIMNTFAEAVALAADDYAHSDNFFSSIETNKSFIDPVTGKKKPGWYIWKIVMPFAKSAWNWFQKSLDYTPLGLANSVVRYTKLEKQITRMENNRNEGIASPSSRFTEFIYRRKIGRGVMGTIGTVIGIILVSLGAMDIDDEDGKLKLKFGDNVYLDISELFGMSSIVAGASIAKGGKGWEEALGQTFGAYSEGFFLQDFLNSARYNDTVWEFATSQSESFLSSFIPNMLKVFNASIQLNKVKYAPGILGSLQRIAANLVPGLSYAYDVVYDPFTGKPRKKYAIPVISKILESAFHLDIYYLSEEEIAAQKLGITKAQLTGEITIDGEKVQLDRNKVNEYYGQLNATALSNLINGKTTYTFTETINRQQVKKTLVWSKMTEEQKKTAINGLMTKNASVAKINAWTSAGNKYYTSLTTMQELKRLGIQNIYLETAKLKGYIK
jgi:hypothetical protein